MNFKSKLAYLWMLSWTVSTTIFCAPLLLILFGSLIYEISSKFKEFILSARVRCLKFERIVFLNRILKNSCYFRWPQKWPRILSVHFSCSCGFLLVGNRLLVVAKWLLLAYKGIEVRKALLRMLLSAHICCLCCFLLVGSSCEPPK